ncbi:MAG: hypothetical protein U5K43_07285 [Halofilum sp. (in: g-proteobacteria)]|nr:hypothetical protein [Halofilum sp. (in: g-proteobacteria)]
MMPATPSVERSQDEYTLADLLADRRTSARVVRLVPRPGALRRRAEQ